MTWTKRIIEELKFWEQCKKYGLSIWQCPNFLFLIMGLITIIVMIGTYFVANFYTEPYWVVASVVGIAIFILSIGWLVVQSFERMAEAYRMKTEFVSIASHQLRSPLSSIRWSLEVLLSGRLGRIEKKHLEHLSIIRDSNGRMIKLVNDLLSVSKIDENEIILKKEEFTLADIVVELVKKVTALADANNVKISVNISSPDIKVFADRQYIILVFNNLVDNAIRYSRNPGDVVISLKKRGSMVRIEVEDDGVGIPKEDQKNVFHKFFRSQNALRHRTEGTGLGLYLAKAFVEMHDGRIGFNPKKGDGSKFWFELPIK